MKTKTELYSQVLNELDNGIMIFEAGGRLFFCNSTAARLLTISPENAVGKAYGDIFLTDTPNTALHQIIQKTFKSRQGFTQHPVPYSTVDGKTLALNISTKYIDSSQDAENAGGIVVYLKESGKAAFGSTEDELLGAKFEQLEQAYLLSEEQNQQLKRNLKRIEWLKIILTVTLFLLFGAAVIYTRQSVILPKTSIQEKVEKLGQHKIAKVIRDTLTQEIILSGTIDAHRKLTLTAQSNGKVIRKAFNEGDIVEKGHILYELDRKEISKQVRSARVQYIELLEKYNSLKNWDTSLEVMQARRKFELSKIALNDERKKLLETKKLYNKGIIPRIEYGQAQTAFKKLQYDYQNAKQSLEQIEEKGNPDKLEVLRLQLFNAREELDELERKHEAALVRAPVTGIVIRPTASNGAQLSFKNEGDMVRAGDLMATIGATDSYILSAVVGELTVNRLAVGQKAEIASHALPGIFLEGEVQWVATKASETNDLRAYPVRLVISTVADSVRKFLRLGILAEARIAAKEMPNVLTIPIESVFRYQGKNQVYVLDSTGQEQVKTIETGFSDNRRIVIESGLEAGDEVIFP